jgi:hypothetical protein
MLAAAVASVLAVPAVAAPAAAPESRRVVLGDEVRVRIGDRYDIPGAVTDGDGGLVVSGERFRYARPHSRVQGALVGLEDDHLIVSGDEGRTFVPRAAVERIEVRAGKASRGENAGKGALFGLGLGLLVGFAVSRHEETRYEFGTEGIMLASTLVVGLPLAGLGAVVGASTEPGDRWVPAAPQRPVRVTRLTIAPTRKGARAALTLSF